MTDTAATTNYAHPEMLVDTAWVLEHQNDPKVRVVESEHKGTTLVELYVAPGELGRVIGGQGRTAAALRTLAATAGEKAGKTVTLEFRDGQP